VPRLSRSQLLVYGALSVAVLLVGARWARSSPDDGGRPGAESGSGSQPLRVSGGDDRDVVVHVAGAVSRPGVYRLPAGSRVTDAVERAGGALPSAAPDGINLAARLADGQQVIVPVRSSGAGSAPAGTGDGPISLGSASAEQLDTIEGIGPVTAQKIIDYRDQHGGLSSVDELDRISGIGPATMEALRARLQP
jgi:competence protein ComEA